MTKKTNTVTASCSSTRGEAVIREFSNSNMTPEQLLQRAPILLNSEELLRNIPELTPEEQTQFLDRVDQVRRSSLPKSQLHYPRKGVSYYRLVQHKIRNSLGERVQCDRATPDFSCTLCRTRETRQRRCIVWRIYRHLARRLPWRPSSYQRVSHIFRPKTERGKEGKHMVTARGLLRNDIYRFCGNGCQPGRNYPMKTSCRFAVSTLIPPNSLSFTIGGQMATLINT